MTAAGVAAATAVMRRWGPGNWHEGEGKLTVTAMAANLTLGAACAFAGGIVAALLAPMQPLLHALVLALALLVFSALATIELPRQASLMYRIALLAFPPMAALSGGIAIVLVR